MMRRTVVLLALAVLFSGGLKAQTSKGRSPKPAPDAKYEAALDALQELDSASSVGLNGLQFNERVINVKIKVDRLGNNPRYKLLKETTQILVDTSTLWSGYVAGRLPMGSLQGLKARYGGAPYVSDYLSEMESEEPEEGLTKQLWENHAEASYKILWLNAHAAMSEVLGKSPKGSYAKSIADMREEWKKRRSREQEEAATRKN